LGGDLSITFPVQFGRALPTLRIFAVLGLLAAAAALTHVAVTEAEAKQPWALLGIVLAPPAIWIVILCFLAAFSLRITDEEIQKLFANRWIIVSKPIDDLRSASIAQNTLQLVFADGSIVRLAAMPLRDQAQLERVMAACCPHMQLS